MQDIDNVAAGSMDRTDDPHAAPCRRDVTRCRLTFQRNPHISKTFCLVGCLTLKLHFDASKTLSGEGKLRLMNDRIGYRVLGVACCLHNSAVAFVKYVRADRSGQ